MTAELDGEYYNVTEDGEQFARSLLPVGACPTERQVFTLLLMWESWQAGERDEAWFKAGVAKIAANCHYEGA